MHIFEYFEMATSYVRAVQRYCPSIFRLDGIPLMIKSNNDPYSGRHLSATFQIKNINFWNVPNLSTRDKNSRELLGFYQAEFEIPLLDPVWFKEPSASTISDPLLVTVNSVIHSEYLNETDDVEEGVEESRDVRVDPQKLSYVKWLREDLDVPVTTSIFSTKAIWTRHMQFVDPCVDITVREPSFKQIRDTFRSVVTMRLYFNQTKPDPKRGSIKSTFSTKSRMSSKSVKIPRKKFKESVLSSKENAHTLKKILVAKVNIPLEIPKWHLPYTEYTWDTNKYCSAQKYVPPKPQESENLLAKTKSGNKGTKNKPSKNKETVDTKLLTCRLGVLLKRVD